MAVVRQAIVHIFRGSSTAPRMFLPDSVQFHTNCSMQHGHLGGFPRNVYVPRVNLCRLVPSCGNEAFGFDYRDYELAKNCSVIFCAKIDRNGFCKKPHVRTIFIDTYRRSVAERLASQDMEWVTADVCMSRS